MVSHMLQYVVATHDSAFSLTHNAFSLYDVSFAGLESTIYFNTKFNREKKKK